MDAKTEFELDYWRQANRAESDARQRKILDTWGFSGAPRVLEIGTGPWGGCLPFITAEEKFGIDPLYDEYIKAGLMPVGKWDFYGIPSSVEKLISPSDFDAIVSMNALDHGDADFGCVARIAELLTPGGRFCLHVHLRTPEQLNVGHDHALKFEDLIAATEGAGLRTVRLDLHETDPIEGCAYRTVIGVWEKQ